VASVPLPLGVRHHVRGRRGFRAGRVPRRDVPGQRPVPVLGHCVRHARLLLVRLQQDVPRRLTRLRLLRHVLGVLHRQLCLRVFRAQVRRRDHRQDVPGDPSGPGRQHQERTAHAEEERQDPARRHDVRQPVSRNLKIIIL